MCMSTLCVYMCVYMCVLCVGIFACFTFLSLYLLGKLQCLGAGGRGEGWRLCLALTPLMAATLVGLSRLQDCKHHWDGEEGGRGGDWREGGRDITLLSPIQMCCVVGYWDFWWRVSAIIIITLPHGALEVTPPTPHKGLPRGLLAPS